MEHQHTPLLLEAKQLFGQNRFQEALPHFESAVEHSGCADSFRGLGFCLLALHKYEDAARAFESGIAKCGADAELGFGLAMAYEGQGDHLRAIESLQKTLEINPNHEAARRTLDHALEVHARDLLRSGNVAWAEDMIRRRLELDPTCGDALAMLIELDEKLGRYGDAKRHFRTLAESHPDHPAIYDLAALLGIERHRERGFLF